MLLESRRLLICASTALVLAAGTLGCEEKQKYTPRPAVSGVKANLPAVPTVPQKPIKKGDAFTVWGASLYLRSAVHQKEVSGDKITIEGYVGKTNLPDAPECAVHKAGQADAEDCKPPVPTFWLCDNKNDKPDECIQVMGWVSNFAQVWKAIEEFDKTKDDEEPEPVTDDYWGVQIPRPLPNVGGKVRVTGAYKTTFTGASQGTAADPIMGIMNFRSLEWLEPPPEPATLPGMKLP